MILYLAFCDPEQRLSFAFVKNLGHPDFESAIDLAAALIAGAGVPRKANEDALHIAIAATNGLDYLLTWNCTHIANAVTIPLVNAVCRANGFEPPLIYTPQELMEG